MASLLVDRKPSGILVDWLGIGWERVGGIFLSRRQVLFLIREVFIAAGLEKGVTKSQGRSGVRKTKEDILYRGL